MLRQCFFPASTTYRRRSRNQIRPSTEREVSVTGYFVRRLNLSCRRPKLTENTNSFREKQNCAFSDDETLQLTNNNSFTVKSSASRRRHENGQLVKMKKQFQLSDKKQPVLQIKLKKKPDFRLLSSKSRKVGIVEIKNQQLNLNIRNQRINMTQRIKPKPVKDFEHIIVGWQCNEETDNYF